VKNLRTQRAAAAILSAATAGLLPSANASVLVTVDARNTSAIVFTSTGAAASASWSVMGGGIHLRGVMASDGSISLQTPPQPDPFRPFVSNVGFVNYGDQDDALRLIVGGTTFNTYIAGTQAFVGTTTVDLSFLNFLPASTIGNIEIRNVSGQNTGVIIGQHKFIINPGNAYWSGALGNAWNGGDLNGTNWVTAPDGTDTFVPAYSPTCPTKSPASSNTRSATPPGTEMTSRSCSRTYPSRRASRR
jgi:hypothetical protein